MKRSCGTGTLARAAAHTFGVVGLRPDGAGHGAGTLARTTIDTFMLIDRHSDKREIVEECVYRAEGTEIAAEGAVYHHRERQYQQQYRQLVEEKSSDGRGDCVVEQGERYAALERTRRANIFAEPRVTRRAVAYDGRQKEDKDRKDGVFEPSQISVAPKCLDFMFWKEQVQKLLNKSEWAEPAAHEPSAQRAEGHNVACGCEGETLIAVGCNRLHRADRAGAERARTGIAVEPGDAVLLERTLIYLSARVARNISVAEQRPEYLDRFSQRTAFLLSQCLYTPDICAQLSEISGQPRLWYFRNTSCRRR